MNRTEKAVVRISAEQSGLDIKKITGDTNKHDLGFDSLDEIEFIMAIEDEFDLMIPDAHAERLDDVRAVIDYVESEMR